VLLGAALLTSRSSAQSIAPVVGRDPPVARAWAGSSWDPTLTVDAGGSYEVGRVRPRLRLVADAAFRAPVVLLPGFDAWQLAFGATGLWSAPCGFGVAAGLHPDVRLAHDATGTKVAFGASLGARPGYYGRSFSAALDLVWSTAVATHVAHADAVEDTFRDRYPNGQPGAGPEDGFYAFSSHRFRVGAAGGVAVGRSVAVHGAFGFSFTPQVDGIVANPPISPMPFYAGAGGAYRW
jgi:hypothetical protein